MPEDGEAAGESKDSPHVGHRPCRRNPRVAELGQRRRHVFPPLCECRQCRRSENSLGDRVSRARREKRSARGRKIPRLVRRRGGTRAREKEVASDRSNGPRRVRPGPLRNARLSARRGTVPTMARRRDRSRAALALVIYAGFVIVPAKSKGARSLDLSLSLSLSLASLRLTAARHILGIGVTPILESGRCGIISHLTRWLMHPFVSARRVI
jgi:hypothetical protein